MDTDVALANHLAKDLEASFPGVVEAHQDRLYTIALRLLGDRRDAEEVARTPWYARSGRSAATNASASRRSASVPGSLRSR
jgi:hypothetical protein